MTDTQFQLKDIDFEKIQQKEVKKQMLNKLRDRFQLNGSNLDAFFATRK